MSLPILEISLPSSCLFVRRSVYVLAILPLLYSLSRQRRSGDMVHYVYRQGSIGQDSGCSEVLSPFANRFFFCTMFCNQNVIVLQLPAKHFGTMFVRKFCFRHSKLEQSAVGHGSTSHATMEHIFWSRSLPRKFVSAFFFSDLGS